MKDFYERYLNGDVKFDKKTMIAIVCIIAVLSGIFGFIYEFIFYYFNSGMKEFYYRGGNFLPWINIYAHGALLVMLFTRKMRRKPLLLFVLSMLVTGILEYLAGNLIYDVLGNTTRCWDYNKEILNFGNINGYVCLRSVLFFGLSSLLLVYGIIPSIYYIASKVNKKTFYVTCVVIFGIFMVDEIYNLAITRIFNTPRASTVYKSLGVKYLYFEE